MLYVPPSVVDRVGAIVRACGRNAAECVVYVTAPTRRRAIATDLVHPQHAATAASTEVDEDELERIWDLLLERQTTIVLQVHSHPGAAYHSSTDDCWPIIHRPGFPSLVLRSFGARGLEDAHLTVYQRDGRWTSALWHLDHGHLVVEGAQP